MKIKDIYNLPRQSSYDIEKIFTLKEWGRSIFPAQNNLGVDWEMLKKNVPGLQAFSVDTSLNKFYIVSINNQQFILLNYDKEIPYAVEIETEEFLEDEKIIRIRAVIMVERDTQKGIIIGHKGAALKKVGIQARQDLEKFFGKQIHIEMFVKVNKDWRNNQYQLRRFGYNQN
jgi:GTPase Era involved in 16S rRNA processing